MYRVGDTVSDKVMPLHADSILKCTEAQNQHVVHQELAQCCRSGEGAGTHSSTLAWKTPWAGEPGGLQSMGSPRVRHD